MAAVERKVEVVEPDAPDRCQSGHVNGQCRYKMMEGSKFCPMHGGNSANQEHKAKVLRQYQLAKWQDQTDAFADEDAVKSLRGEIGITRLLLQETVSRCKNSGELMLYSGKIGDLIGKIEKLVVSCHRLESSLGNVLDKGKILEIAATMVEIVSKHVTDSTAIDAISNEIVQVILTTSGKDEK